MSRRIPLLPALLAFLAAGAPFSAAEIRHLTLDEAIALGRVQCPLVSEAAAKAEWAKGMALESRSALLPHFSARTTYRNFTFNRETIGLDLPAFSGMDRVIGPVDALGAELRGKIDLVNIAAWRRMRASRSRCLAAGLYARIAADEAAYLAARAYLEFAKAKGETANHRKSLDMARSFLGLVQDQKAAGTATSLDVTRAQLQINSARNAILSADSKADGAKYSLLATLGYEEDQEIVLGDSLAELGFGFPLREEALVRVALESRPELKMERVSAEVSASLVGAARAAGFPVLRAGAGVGADGTAANRLEGVRNFEIALDWNLFEGGANLAKAWQARAEEGVAAAKIREMRNGIAAQTRSALSSFKAAAEMVRVAEEYQALSRTELEQSQERFRSGLAGSLDVIEAQNAFIKSQNGRIEALHAYNRSRIDLLRAIGRLGSGTSGG